jgi:hypothetical protein
VKRGKIKRYRAFYCFRSRIFETVVGVKLSKLELVAV